MKSAPRAWSSPVPAPLAPAFFSTGNDSPVSAAWRTNKSCAASSRPSAGTRDPAASRTTSPGTSVATSSSRSWPSRSAARAQRHGFAQALRGCFGAALLDLVQGHAEQHDRGDDAGAGRLARHQRYRARGQQHQHHRIAQAMGHLVDQATPLRRRQPIGAPLLQPLGRLGLCQSLCRRRGVAQRGCRILLPPDRRPHVDRRRNRRLARNDARPFNAPSELAASSTAAPCAKCHPAPTRGHGCGRSSPSPADRHPGRTRATTEDRP